MERGVQRLYLSPFSLKERGFQKKFLLPLLPQGEGGRG
jgi:hypothetical protein